MRELTWDSLFERFSSARRLARATLSQYRRTLGLFATFTGLASPLEVLEEHVKAYYLHLKQGPLTEVTVVGQMRGLVVMLRWAAKRDLLLVDPTHDFPIRKAPRVIPRILTRTEVLLLIEATGHHLRSFCRLRDRALLELLYGTGMRVGEVAGLQLSDLDLADSSLHIRISKGRPRRAPFGLKVAEALTAYLAIRSRVAQSGELALFVAQHGARLSRGSMCQIVCHYSKKTGIEASAHAFRRAFATHLLENGANIVEVKLLLGHADLNSTQFYIQIAPVELTRAHRESHPRARRRR